MSDSNHPVHPEFYGHFVEMRLRGFETSHFRSRLHFNVAEKGVRGFGPRHLHTHFHFHLAKNAIAWARTLPCRVTKWWKWTFRITQKPSAEATFGESLRRFNALRILPPSRNLMFNTLPLHFIRPELCTQSPTCVMNTNSGGVPIL